MSDKPVFKAKMGSVQCAVWKNVSEDDRVMHSATFEKRYKDKNGDWKTSNSFSLSDLANLQLLVGKCLEYGYDVSMGADV